MHILFADDSTAAALPVIAFLEQQGHRITFVQDGAAAVAAYQAEPPQLVLMDVNMPVMDGIAATRQIKALGGQRWTPLILMTGLSATEEIVAGLDAGADDYLGKPIALALLEARMRSMQRIANIQDSLAGILDNVLEAILTIDAHGIVNSYNRAAKTIFGYGADEVIGHNVKMLMPEPYASEHDDYLGRYLREQTPRVIGIGRKVQGRRKNGDIFPMRLSVTELKRNNSSQFIGLVSDISIEERARQRIEFLALHDTLTNLPNRTQFNARLEALCAQPGSGTHALLFLDLDGFKPINDTLGHQAGDDALKIAAQRLRHALTLEDFVARLGGDEFVAICHDISTAEAALAIGNRLLSAIAQPMTLLGNPSCISASIGIALLPQHGSSATEILTAADKAMYAAKRRGKGRVMLAENAPVA